MRSRLPAFALGLLAITPRAPCAEPLFAAPFLSLDAGDRPVSIVIGDLNGDERLDLAVANYGSDSVSVFLGNGDGSFGAKTDFRTGRYPNSVAIGDLNGDGRLDLAVANEGTYYEPRSTVSVLLGNGDGSFGPKTDFETGGHSESVAIGDLNKDGRPDLAVANYDSNSVSVLLGNGDGSFGPRTDFGTGRYPNSVAIGDLNVDGWLDLAVANDGAVSVLLGNGDGSFGAKTDFGTGTSNNACFVAIGDLNSDGRPDLVVAYDDAVAVLLGNGDGNFRPKTDVGRESTDIAIGDLNGDGQADLVAGTVLLGNGDGSFEPNTDSGTGLGRYLDLVAIGDLNGDGRPDLAVAIYASNTVAVLLGNGDGSFGPRTDLGTGSNASSVAIGDLNGDGPPDLAVANAGSNTVSVFLGNGDGSFGPKSDFGTGVGPVTIATGDLNGDGRPDLVVADSGTYLEPGSTVSVLLGNGDGTFGTKTDFGTGSGPVSVASDDLNRDGRPDLPVANSNANTVSVLLGNGDGSFGLKTDFATGDEPVAVATGDLNGDGRPDLAVADSDDFGDGGTVAVLLGNGDGTVGTKTEFGIGTGVNPVSVAIGDLNGDGRPDLATANLYSNTVSVLLGNGDGSFVWHSDFGTGTYPKSVAIGDLNGDGWPDLAVANSESWSVSVLLGNGDGTFGPKTDFGTGYTPFSVAIGDLNGDRRPDLVVANYSSNTVSVLLNRGGTTPVEVEDLEAVAVDGRVQVRWRLSAEARCELEAIDIQRATAVDGPYVLCSTSQLQPAIDMSFEDVGLESGRYWYRLVLISRDGSRALAGPVGVQAHSGVTRVTALHQPFEPPDGGPIQIRYTLAEARVPVRVAIYDVRGRLLWSSQRSVRDPGEHTQLWARSDRSGMRVSRGVYFVGLDAAGVTDRKKLLLVHR